MSLLLIATNVSAQCPGVSTSFTIDQTFFCGAGPYTLNFTNTTTGSSGPSSFEWFEDGVSFATTPNVGASVSTNITAVGTYQYMLVYSDPTVPCSDTAYVSVTIAPAPNANYTFTPNNGCAYQDVDFTNTSTGTDGTTTYAWNFNPGSSTVEDPTAQFNGAGSYNVTLTIDNGPGCTSTSTQTVDVIDAPSPNISGDDGDGDLVYCLFPGDNTTTETVTFSNATTNATSYEWDFGDGSPIFTTGSLANFTHDYTSYGTFNVTMTATGANGCQTVANLTVIFEKFVSAALTVDLTEYSGCTPHTMATLTNLSVNATTFVWDFGDGTVITTTDTIPPVYAYTTAGSYTITLTASNSCNQATATISPIIIIEGPVATFNPSVTNGCAPQTINFANTTTGAQPANNFQWDMGNGNTYTNTINPPAQVYPTVGTYNIELIAGNACGYDTINLNVFIDTIPTIDLILDPITGCSPLNVDPTATLFSGTNVNWWWYVDGAYYSNTPNDIANQNFVSLNPNDSTLHTIQVNVSNICGSDSDVESVYVHPPVIANFTTLDTICLGDVSTFTNTSTGTELTYSWNFGDGSPLDLTINPTHTYLASGTYTVTLTTTGVCGVDIYTFDVAVLDIPIIDIVPNPTSICSGESITFTNNSSTDGSYYWDFGPNGSITSSTLFDPGAITFSGTGTQTISFAINYAGCQASDTVYVDVNPIPVPAMTINPLAGCTPLPTTITNTTIDAPGHVYTWDYGNGSTSTGIVPNNQTYLAGIGDTTYTIQLIVTSVDGCIDSTNQTVTVYQLPNATFTILDDTICMNEAMLFANNSTNANNYLWDFGDGNTSAMISPGHTFAGSGTFQVSLVAYTINGCTDTALVDIFIDSIPTAAFTNSIECFGNITSFTNSSTGSPVSYEWDFGDGSPLDNTVNPTHLYGASGSYLVTLTVMNGVNCTSSIPQIVQVNDVPVADFVWSQTCDGQAMNFTDQSLNFPIGWTWDFGDGGSDIIQNPSNIYADTGSYTVQLIVSGGSGCLDSITFDVYVDSIPTAGFNFVEACTNDSLLFTNTSIISPDNYTWDFGDGNTSTLIDPSHSYITAGIYTVTLTAQYASNGCTNSITQDVESYPRTVPAFIANTPCLGQNTDFIDQTTNTPITWEWDFGDGSGPQMIQNPTHLYLTAGLFDVTLITSNAYGCSDTLQQQIEIFGLPTADFTFSTVCEGAITQFTDNSVGDVSWQWDFGDAGATSLSENPTHLFSSNGSFTTELVVFNAVGCSDTISYPIVVNPNPVAGFYVNTACFGYQSSFVDTSLNAVSWLYNFGDGTTSVLSDPTHIYPNDGTFTVQQNVTNIFGCSDSITVNIIVYPQPEAGFMNSTVCAQDVVDFVDTTLGGPTYWEWDFGDGSALDNTQDPTHIYNLGGTYDVTLIAGNSSGCLDTVTTTIDVFTNPVAVFDADTVCFLEVTTFTDLSTDVVPIVSWFYDFGDGINNSNLQNPTYIYQTPGVFPASITITNINGCDSTFDFNVIVNNIPTAEFDYDTVCWGSPTTFTDNSLGTVNSWDWQFGDGGSANTGPVVTYTYPNAGTYIASMEVDGGAGCTDIMYHIVTVIDVLTPIIGVQDTACLNEDVQFQDLSITTNGTITGWLWDFGDGSTSNLENPVHAYTTSGVYNVTLDVTTSTGCTNQGSYVVTVFDPPNADFSFTIPCEGQPTIFTDLSSDPNGTIYSWLWDFGDASPTETIQNPQHQYAVAGTYPVTLDIVSSNGCSATITQDAIIYPSPTASFNFGLECGGVPIPLVSTSTGNIANYEWIYGGNTIATDSSTTYIFPTDTDTHPVSLVVTTNLGCIDTITQDVITKAVVLFDFGPFETAGCPVMEVDFFENSVTTSGGTIVNWLWDMGDSSYSFSPNPTHFYEDEGSYTVSLQVITSDDCIYSDTLAYSIIVYPQPVANFYYLPAEINILHAEVEFTNTSSGAQDVEWYLGDFDYSNDWNPIHLYADTGLFDVTQIVYNEFGCSDTMTLPLYVHGNFVVYLPNTFTPDGSGVNDVFSMNGYGFDQFELLIFNRWGEVVKTITDLSDSWDGTYGGQPCQDGVYTWRLRAVDFEEIPHEMAGHVTLMR